MTKAARPASTPEGHHSRPLGPGPRPLSPGHHAVRFYESDRSLAVIVAQFLGDGLAEGHPAVVIATAAQRAAIVRELAARSWDVVELQRLEQLLLRDAEETLSTFMMDGQPDAERFQSSMWAVMKSASRVREDCSLRVYGQMVNVLWEGGKQEAAIRLEMLWNVLAKTQSFSLMCGYAMGPFYKEVHVEEICSHHTHVVSAEGEAVEVARAEGR